MLNYSSSRRCVIQVNSWWFSTCIFCVVSVVIVCSLSSWYRPAMSPNQHVLGSTGFPLLTWQGVKGLQRLRQLVQGPRKLEISMFHWWCLADALTQLDSTRRKGVWVYMYTSVLPYIHLVCSLRWRKGDLRIVPFRESKLTQLFQNFFVGKGHCAGQGRVILLVNVSPAPGVFDETLQVLKFSALANQVMMSTRYSSSRWFQYLHRLLWIVG